VEVSEKLDTLANDLKEYFWVLREIGAIFADHLSGQQARIELSLALGVTGAHLTKLREIIEWWNYRA
jgi:hypothetical protein